MFELINGMAPDLAPSTDEKGMGICGWQPAESHGLYCLKDYKGLRVVYVGEFVGSGWVSLTPI